MDQPAQILRSLGFDASGTSDHGAFAVPALILQIIGFTYAKLERVVWIYGLTIFSAIIPIYTGAHASLIRPKSAAKPPKRPKPSDISDDEIDEQEPVTQMESLGPEDAILLPVLAGVTLTGLYCLIKWLEDPALLSKVLNWYFAVFGIFSTAKMMTDAMSAVHDFIFPNAYFWRGRTWLVGSKNRRFVSTSDNRWSASPLPKPLYRFDLPAAVTKALWTLRELPLRKIRFRLYIHKIFNISIKIGPLAIINIILATTITMFTMLVSTPWYLNNLVGFAFVYSSLQMLSPTTSSTASLILGALFVYDIYFVFFTPIMVTVATQLDIPAKLLLPRPGGMSMLGLGDLVIPGMVIGWALRFDLWLHYLKKQKRADASSPDGTPNRYFTRSHNPDGTPKTGGEQQSSIIKPTYHPAIGNWGTRFWTRSPSSPYSTAVKVQGTQFPKPYFYATLKGYIAGMATTLLVMQLYGHAQPALLYLVPGVLGFMWAEAYRRGQVGVMWNYVEGEDADDAVKKDAKGEGWRLKSLFRKLWTQADSKAEEEKKGNSVTEMTEGAADKAKEMTKEEKIVPEWSKGQLVHFSVSYVKTSPPQLVVKWGRLVTKPLGVEAGKED